MKMLNLLLLLCASVCFCAENLKDNLSEYTVEQSAMCAFTTGRNYMITSMIEKNPASYQFCRLLVGPMVKQVDRETSKGVCLICQVDALIDDMHNFVKKHSKDLSPADSNERTTLLDLYHQKRLKAFRLLAGSLPERSLHSILQETKETCLQLEYDIKHLKHIFEGWISSIDFDSARAHPVINPCHN